MPFIKKSNIQSSLFLLKLLSWFERERPELYEKFVKPLLDSYEE
jgi:hypothetical protein